MKINVTKEWCERMAKIELEGNGPSSPAAMSPEAFKRMIDKQSKEMREHAKMVFERAAMREKGQK